MNEFRRVLNCIIIFCLLIFTGSSFAEDIRTQKEEPASFIEGSWTVVVLPDTQGYTKRDENIKVFDKMVDWIVGNKDRRNIRSVVHVGDMTASCSAQEERPDIDVQWQRLRASYKKLDNVVPYVVCEGNHDVVPSTRTSRLNDYFKLDENPLNKAIFKESYEDGKLQNAYYVFNQNGQKYLFLALEFATRGAVIEWADKVIKEHPDHRVLITVHKYLSEISRLVSKDGKPDFSDTDTSGVFEQLVQTNPNVEFVVCGHVGAVKKGAEGKPVEGYEGTLVYDKEIATGHRSDTKEKGLTAHQMLFNAQWLPNGGDGWMLLLEFSPDNKVVHVKTYSSYLNLWRTGSEYEYALKRTDTSQQENAPDEK